MHSIDQARPSRAFVEDVFDLALGWASPDLWPRLLELRDAALAHCDGQAPLCEADVVGYQLARARRHSIRRARRAAADVRITDLLRTHSAKRGRVG